MRKWWLLLVALLAVCVCLAEASGRIDLVPDANGGYRLTAGGATVLRVEPVGQDQARVIDFRGNARTIVLPRVKPFRPPPSEFAWPAFAPPPGHVLQMFTTLIDGLSLLLTDAAMSGADGLRFGATVRLRTAEGHLGRCVTEIVARQVRMRDPELDRRVERLLTAGALPPLISGQALVDVGVAVSGTARPVLNLSVSVPRRDGADALIAPDDVMLYQETLGLPRAVRESPAARQALAAYQAERQKAATDLLARLNGAPARPLFGDWRMTAGQTLAEAHRALPAAPDADKDALRFLGAWALVLERREVEAGKWMAEVAAHSAIPALADEAAFLTTTWYRRGTARVFNADYPATDSGPRLFMFETDFARGLRGEPRTRYDRARREIAALSSELFSRPDAPLLLHASLNAAADALAELVAGQSAGDAARLARALVTPYQPLADRLVFDAGVRLLRRRDISPAIEMFRLLLEYAPQSPLAPEAAWRMVLARIASGDREAALDLARAVDEQFGPGAPWHDRRGSTADAAPWAAGLAGARGANEARRLALRLLRDAYAADETTDPARLANAEYAARRLLDTTRDDGDRRAEWLALGHLSWRQGKRDEARAAYANAALSEPDDEIRRAALAGLAASALPDAARVAAALRGDPLLGVYVAPLLREP